jgi:Meiotically up-regulated gene 113
VGGPLRLSAKGFIYILAAGDSIFKIGKTTRLSKRSRQLEIQLPRRVEVALVIATNEIHGREHELHQEFASSRLNGEWFELSQEDLERLFLSSFVSRYGASEDQRSDFAAAVADSLLSDYAISAWGVS